MRDRCRGNGPGPVFIGETVVLIGFVSAGLMTFQQATGVILGANIGTTITAQLIAFKQSKAAQPAIALGVFLNFLPSKKNTEK